MEKAVERLSALQSKRENIRNICVLAHVDHGKTTLSDGLIVHNVFISQKLAGKLRFMDFLDDEQRRGITMKSAAISLLYTPKATPDAGEPEPLLINLIDSPGHVDFCSEVSTAARLSDGGLVVVDVVEGICVQTHAVLRQAWEERLQVCLVFNKLDRLIIEMGYTPLEAYERMRNLLHEINGVMSAFVSEKFISQADTLLASAETFGCDNVAEGEETAGDDAELEDVLTDADHSDVAFLGGSGQRGVRVRGGRLGVSRRLVCGNVRLQARVQLESAAKGALGGLVLSPQIEKDRGEERQRVGNSSRCSSSSCSIPIWKMYHAAEAEKHGYPPEGKDLATMAASLKVDVP